MYREGIPDFSVCAKVTVSIENMDEIRRENFRKCDIKYAEIWGRKSMKEKVDGLQVMSNNGEKKTDIHGTKEMIW